MTFRGGHPTICQAGFRLRDFAVTASDLSCILFECRIIRIENFLIFQHCAGHLEQPISHTSQSSGMSVPPVSKSRVFGFADRIMLTGDSSPMIDGVLQLRVDGSTTEHHQGFAGTFGHAPQNLRWHPQRCWPRRP